MAEWWMPAVDSTFNLMMVGDEDAVAPTLNALDDVSADFDALVRGISDCSKVIPEDLGVE